MTEIAENPYAKHIPRPYGNFENGYETTYVCPFCPCEWANMNDLNTHMQAFGRDPEAHKAKHDAQVKQSQHGYNPKDGNGEANESGSQWFKSKFSDDEWLMHEGKDPELARQIRVSGKLFMGNFEFCMRGPWIIKKQVGV